MSVVLAILNGILITILVLLLIIIILALIIFFMPVKYNVSLQYIDEKLAYNIKVSWLFRLVSLSMKRSDTEDEAVLKLAWKRLNTNPYNNMNEPGGKEAVLPGELPEGKSSKDKDASVKDESANDTENISIKEEEGGIIKKIKGFFDIFKEIKEMNISINEIFKEIILLLKRLLLALKPKAFTLDLEIGLETPDKTGITIGAAAVFNGIINTYPYKINIKGNFEEEVLSLTSKIKGKIVLWFGLWPFIRLYFSKSMKPIRKIVVGKLLKRKQKKI